MAGQDRTEAATPKRRSEARGRGQVARSPELTAAIVLIGGMIALRSWSDHFLTELAGMTRGTFAMVADPAVTPLNLRAAFLGTGIWFAETLGPLLGALLALGLAANFAQTGLLVTLNPLAPSFGRLNPLNGVQRIVSARSLFELLKCLGKLGTVLFVTFQVVRAHTSDLMTLAVMPLSQAIPLVLSIMYGVLIDAGLVLLAIGAVDYGYQRYQFEKSIRMSKEELREEYRQTEGSPQIKEKIRERQRAMARRRMMQEVPKAAVVITNPTHLAIALRYDDPQSRAPRVVAKGADLIAQQVRNVAADHGVPLVENKTLAQALYKSVDLDQEIPAELHRAVAEVLAFVQVMNQRRIGVTYGV